MFFSCAVRGPLQLNAKLPSLAVEVWALEPERPRSLADLPLMPRQRFQNVATLEIAPRIPEGAIHRIVNHGCPLFRSVRRALRVARSGRPLQNQFPYE